MNRKTLWASLAFASIIGSSLALSGCQSATPTEHSPSKVQTNTQSASTEEAVAAASNSSITSKDLIYFVMTDRFYDGTKDNNQFPDYNPNNPKAFHGGDFVGLTQKLDYIKSLGTTAIWVTPIVKNQAYGYHGYWSVDPETTDPHLGTEKEFKTFVDEAHKRGMKVLVDYVVNHTGYESPWLKDATKKDWFHDKKDITNWADQKEIENNWLFGLPDLNTENTEVAKFIINNAKSWVKKTGIDGMRLDTVRHVPRTFWNQFASALKADYPNFYLLGEVWSDNVRYLQLYNDEGIDGLTDYSLYNGITGTFKASGSSSSLYNALAKEKFFKYPQQNGVFMDNHDNPRFISANGKAYAREALTFVMTYPAVPILYYGTEIGMEGKGDPDNRRQMAWDTVDNNNTMAFYQKLLSIRQSIPEIQTGIISPLKTSNDLVGYTVTQDGKGILVLMNLRKKPVTEAIPLEEGQPLKLVSTPLYNSSDNNQVKFNGSTLNVTLEPGQILIFESRP